MPRDADRQTNDLSSDFLSQTGERSKSLDVREMEQFAAQAAQGEAVQPKPIQVMGQTIRPLPEKPQRRKTDDELGRLPVTTDQQKSSLMRNVAEVPGQALAGVESAVHNALGWGIDPLANWLNEHVADLSYTRDAPKTPTGEITKSISEFLTGFVPALKGLRAAGMTGNIIAPLAAGAIADFSARDPASGRLADLWKKLELPQNVLTDYLASNPKDTEIEQRFKNALEGAGIGVATEGVFLAARALRSFRGVKGAKQTEEAYLKEKYGEIDDQTFNRVIGDPSKPSVEMIVHEPSPAGAKIAAGAKATENVDPRTILTMKGPKPEPVVPVPNGDVFHGTDAPLRKIDFEKGRMAWFGDEGVAMSYHAIKSPVLNPKGIGPERFSLDIKNPFNLQLDLGAKFDVAAVKKAFDLSDEELAQFAKAAKVNLDVKGFGGAKKTWGMVGPGQKVLVDILKSRGYDGIHTLEQGRSTWAVFDPGQIKAPIGKEAETRFGGPADAVPASSIPELKQPVSRFANDGAKSGVPGGTFYTEGKGAAGYSELHPQGVLSEKQIPPDAKVLVLDMNDEAALARIAKDAEGNPHLGPEEKVTDATEANMAVEAATKKWNEQGYDAVVLKNHPDAESLGVPSTQVIALDNLAERTTVKSGDFNVYINFARFNTPEEIKNAIGKMADHAKGSIDEATRGVMSQKETEKLAEEMGLSITDVLARNKGQPFNAETAVAARQLWAASGERLVELAKLAAGKNAGPLDLFNFRKQMAVHSAIQAEVIGARTETARALASWNIPVKGGIERARAVDQVMQAMGGPENASEMARRLAILAETGADPATIAKFANQGAAATTMDAVREVWINGLLSSPKTHIVNVMSNTLVALTSIPERMAAAGIRELTGGEGVHFSEGLAMTYGMVSAIREAFQISAKALKTGETSWTFNKMDLPKTHALSAEAFNMSKETMMGRAVDYLGTTMRVPTRLLGAEDEFFKTIGYRMELHAQAVRQARTEGLEGYELGKRVADIVQNPPEHIMINSADAALYQTFTNEVGSFGAAMMKLRESNPVLTFILPFVRTPVNIARYAFERTPFAPLVGQWRADIAAGGARADLALARMSTGTAIMLTALDFADKGLMTGSGFRGGKDTALQEAEERQGMQPYSIKVGNKWVSYNRADPFGMTVGFAASIAEAVRKGEISEDEVDEWQEVMAMSIAAVSQVAINKTYLEGFAKFVEVMSDAKRYSQKYVDDLFASFLPFTSASSAVKNVVDPVQREVNNPSEAVQARIAGLSKDLPPRRDLWGKEITQESGMGKVYDALSPATVKDQKDSPIDREMVRLNQGTERIRKQTPFDGVQANFRFHPKAYDDYVRLAGNDLKHPAWGMGAKDYLDSVVAGKSPMSVAYNYLSDESRKEFIQSTIGEYRRLAQQQVLADPKHAGFAAEIAKMKQINQGAHMPYMGN